MFVREKQNNSVHLESKTKPHEKTNFIHCPCIGHAFACNSTDKKQAETNLNNLETETANTDVTHASEANYIIQSDQVGYLSVGDEQIKINPKESLVKFEKSVSEEGETYLQEFKYVLGPKNDTLIEINSYGIWVLNEAYKTEENISVGSSMADFYGLFADAKIEYSYVSDMLWMSTEQYEGIEFILPNDAYQGDMSELTETDLVEIQPQYVTEEAKIVKIRLF